MVGYSKELLTHALRSNHIQFAFQPVTDLHTGDVLYVESLVRWNHPDRGLLMPASFLPQITDTATADLLTERTLEVAIDAIDPLRERYGNRVRIGINLSNLQLKGRAAELVVEAAGTHGSGAEWLTIELVEDLVIDDLGVLTTALDACRASGAHVMLDDFGTGTATLSLLTDLGYDGVKLDRRYVSAINTSTPARLLVESLVRFGHGANVEVIAEGIEDAGTANELRGMHCRYGQGFHLGRPASIADLTATGSGASRGTRWADGPGHGQLSPAGPPDPEGARLDEQISADVTKRLADLEPTTTSLAFPVLVEILDEIEAQVAEVGDPETRLDLLIDVRHRRVLCALYFGCIDEVLTWGVELAAFCETQGRMTQLAHALALVASTTPADTQQRNIATDALVRMLQLRDNEALDLAALTRLDNNIGAIFAHLGLLDEAFNWWLHNFRRAGDLADRSVHLNRLNLIEHVLSRHEVSRFGYASRPDPVDADLELLDELLAKANPETDLGSEVHASYQCRRFILAGDLEAACKVMEPEQTLLHGGMLVHYSTRRAMAVLSRAQDEPEEFLKHTYAMIATRPERGVMLLHQRETDRLHAEALAANGRFEAAFEFIQAALENETRESSAATGAVYTWLQSQVALDRPFLRQRGEPDSGAPTPLRETIRRRR